jgi:hypothetical protein
MAFQVSPGINVSEIDLSTTIPAVSTTEGAFAGAFNWGPVGTFTLVDSQNKLVARYGRPDGDTFETFFTAANFLDYGNTLFVSRAATTTGFSNTATATLQSNTTLTIADPALGVATGQGVYGEGIPEGTTVSTASTNATHTIVTLSVNATVSTTASVNFFDTDQAFSAVANTTAAVSRQSSTIKNSDHKDTVTVPAGIEFVAKYPGEFGNSLKVSAITTAEQYSSTIDPFAFTANTTLATNNTVIPTTGGVMLNVNETTANVYISNSATLTFADTYNIAAELRTRITVGDYIEVGNSSIGKQSLKVKSVGALANTGGGSPTGEITFNVTLEEPFKLSTNWTSQTLKRNWEYYNIVDLQPGVSSEVTTAGGTAVDQMSVVVIDQDGKFTGNAGTVLEVFRNLSRATDAKNDDGTVNYYQSYINDNSAYIWATNDISTAPSAVAASVANATGTVPYTESFNGGADGSTESNMPIAALATAYDLFADETSVDISLVLAGKARGANDTQLANYIIDNISEVRKDCVTFISPAREDVVGSSVLGAQSDNIVTFRNNLRSSSYSFIDSGYKYQYDKYNDVFRYVPLNGDIAGLAARTDDQRDPWFSPAGFSRGQIKNVVKLAYNPKKSERDLLYKNDINPVVTFPGQGTVLYGDKTGLGKASAFDRINVRRLFIVLRKTVSNAAQQMLFEFNDEFTRAQFKNLVEPFLRDVQGRRGIYDFRVVCDETNNNQGVIDSNRFVGDIYVKPAKSINYMQLNFIAVGTDVSFDEVAGSF